MTLEVPCTDMEVEGLGQGVITGTDGVVREHEQPIMEYVTEVIQGEDNASPSNPQVLKSNKGMVSLSQ